MDITLNKQKTMNSKQLRKIIREAIDEVLNEDSVVTKDTPTGKIGQIAKGEQVQPADVKAAIEQAKKSGKPVTIIGKGMSEGEEANLGLDEMANIGALFQLAPDADVSTLTGQKSRIASAIQAAEGPISQKGIAIALGYDKQNPINAKFLEMVRDGIIVPANTQDAPRFSRSQPAPGGEQGGEVGRQATDPADLFVGSTEDPLAMYFDGEPNADGSEDITDEPEAGELEKAVAPTSSISDEDYEAWDKYDTLKNRLNGVKSDLNRMKRSRGKGGTAGDISDKPSTEEQRLRDLKKSLEDRINVLVAGSDYLKKRTGQETSAPEIEDIEDEEPVSEGLDEYTKRKLQFYAGIIK